MPSLTPSTSPLHRRWAGQRSARPVVLSVALLLLTAGLTVAASPAHAATITQSDSCVDGSGVHWTARVDWGDVYQAADGSTRVSLAMASWTADQAGPVDTDSTVRTFDGAGVGLQWLGFSGSVDYDSGQIFKVRHLDDPVSSPGKDAVTVALGEEGDSAGSCTMTFHQPGTPAATPPAGPSSLPSSPPAKICGNAAVLAGPSSAPSGAVVVPAGDNSSVDFSRSGATYWFAPGVHTLGTGAYDQIIPGDGSTFTGAPGAVLDGQHKNLYAFTQHAHDVTIEHLTVQNFVAPNDEGTVNHDSGVGWTMRANTVQDNGGAGIFLGAGNAASSNCLKDNSQYGFQVYSDDGGTSGVVLDHNEITGNNTGDWETRQPGCGCTGGGKFWDSRNVRVTNNYVHDNLSVGLWADTNDNNFLFEGNWIEDNAGQAIFWEISYNVAIRNNVIRHNLVQTGPERVSSGDNFPDAAIYISESGGDARLPHDLVGSATIDIANNSIEDNYNGVTLWENADRFCGSPANTSSDYCTLVNPSVAKVSTCNSTNISKEPYYSDCRWKTQNVKVHDNTFVMDPGKFANCSPAFCGRNSIVGNWGSYPSWSPYQGDVISQALVKNRGNQFSDNRYQGPWHFTAVDTGELNTPAQWKAAPYNQDTGSTFSP